MPTAHRLRHIIAATILAIAAPVIAVATLTGCAGFLTALPTVSETVNDASVVLALITTSANAYFRSTPNPALQARVDLALQTTQAALVAGEQALLGVENATQGQTAAAFAAFASAYADLMALVGQIGIVPAGQPIAAAHDAGVLTVAPAHAVIAVIPTPMAVRMGRGSR